MAPEKRNKRVALVSGKETMGSIGAVMGLGRERNATLGQRSTAMGSGRKEMGLIGSNGFDWRCAKWSWVRKG